MSQDDPAQLSEAELFALVERIRQHEPELVASGGGGRMSFAQERLWLVDQLGVAGGAYNVPRVWRLRGELDVARLERALRRIVARHEVLRARFELAAGMPEMVVDDAGDLPLRIVDGGYDVLAEEARQPFLLAQEPPLRALLVRVGPDHHLLALTMHHIVCDGWSMGVLARELSVLYAGGELAALPVQYSDFVRWERERLSGAALEELLSYWRGRLAGLPPVLELPGDRPRPAVQSFGGGWVRFGVPGAVVRGLRRPGVTLFMSLLAGFAVVLGRWSGRADVAVGSPMAGRSRVEVEDLIGFFVNTVVLRIDLGGDPTVGELLGRVRDTVLDAHRYAEMPFERLVEDLAPERSLAHTPLVQVMFVLQNAPREKLTLPGLSVSSVPLDTGTSKFDLTLSMTETGDGLDAVLEYSTDLFDASAINRFSAHLITVLEAFAADPRQRLSCIALVSEAERERANHTTVPVPGTCLHELFEAQADRTPDGIAVRYGGRSITYAELDRRANRLAHHLIQRGVGPGVLVGVRLPRSLDTVIALLAILKAGGGYLPLDPAYPPRRLEYMLTDSCAAMVLTELDDQLGPCGRPGRRASPSDTAYVIYTSGSTGQPKGVIVEHHSVVNLITWAGHALGDAVAAPWTVFHSFSFDYSVWETFVPLSHGGTAVIVPADLRDPADFVGLLAREHVAVLSITPSGFRMLTGDETPWRGAALALATVVFGGEALQPHHIPAWFHTLLPGGITNMYGITEITVHATTAPVTAGQPITIGHPITNTRLYLLDEHLQPVPPGAIGEIHIAGAGLARGYHNRPALTAQRFIPNPYGPGRLYRTGDYARYRGSTLEFVGRRDRQVKIRGYRIELPEIEAALGDAIVIDRDGTLTAYTRNPIDQDQLRATLPDHMIPATFIHIDTWPLTANGKIDHTALPAPTHEQHRPAGTQAAELVAEQMAAVLGLAVVGVDANFFALGGDSMLATRLVARLRQTTGVELTLRRVFEAPTARGIAAALAKSPVTVTPIPARGGGGGRMSFAQERLWLVDQLGVAGGAYNVPRVWRLRGELDVARLERALRRIVARHEVLRARFELAAGMPEMVVDDAGDLPLRIVDGGYDVLAEEARQPFLLAQEPPLRALLVRVGPDHHLLALTMHHIVCDGWSVGVMERELSVLYAGGELAALPVQYSDFVRWERERLSGAALEELLSYWRGRLAGLPPVLELPGDRPRPAVQSFRGASVRFGVDVGPLRELGRRTAVTLFMSLLAGFAVVLGRWSGRADVAVGSPMAGRSRVEVEDLIGFFVNTVVLRIDLGGDPTVGELLGRVRDTVLDAHRYAEMPFERLVEDLAPERSLAHTPLVQVMFVLQNAPLEAPLLPGLETCLLPVTTETSKFDMTLYATVDDTRVALTLTGATDLFELQTLERFGAELISVLTQFAEPKTLLSALEGIVAAEEDEALTRALEEIIRAYDAEEHGHDLAGD